MKQSLAALCLLLTLSLLGLSCKNGFLDPPAAVPGGSVSGGGQNGPDGGSGGSDGGADGRAYVSLSVLNDGGTGRTVLPGKLDPASLVNYLLVGSKDGGTLQTLGSWATWQDFRNAGAIPVDIGSWDFTLTAQSGAQDALSGDISKVVTVGTNVLAFALKEAASGTGDLTVTLYYPDNRGVEVVKAGLFDLAGIAVAGYPLEELADFDGADTYAGKKGVTYAKTAVPRGFYILKYCLYRDSGATDQMNVYSELVRLAPGAQSTAVRVINDLNTLYEITFNLNGGSGAATLSFNADEHVTLPVPVRPDHTFVGWYEDSSFGGSPISGWNPGDKTADVELYAKWSLNLTLEIKYGTEGPYRFDVAASGDYVFTAVETDPQLASSALSLQAAWDTATAGRGSPAVTWQNSLFASAPENVTLTNGAASSIPLGYGKNTVTLSYEGKTYTITCYAAFPVPVAGTGSSLPAGLRTVTATQKAVDGIAAFTASADYAGTGTGPFVDAAAKAKFSPSVIAVAGTDTVSASSSTTHMVLINSKVPVTLRGYDGSANAIDGSGGTLGILQIKDGANVTLGANLKLTGGYALVGGGVYVSGSSAASTSFTLDGGEISGNRANPTGGGGGGVCVADYSTFYLKSGKVSGNTITATGNSVNGGGVRVTGALIMSGGEISGNTVTNSGSGYASGGGVYAIGGAAVTQTGGKISGNTLTTTGTGVVQGGGVYVINSSFTLDGTGEISGNSVSGTTTGDGGGGVYVSPGQPFLMKGGKIINNSVTSTTTNSAGAKGGGIYAKGSDTTFCDLTITGGEISGNEGMVGGGVYGENSNLTMSNAVIKGNKAKDKGLYSYGGGVYITTTATTTLPPGEFIMNSGVIGGTDPSDANTSEGSGGGVYVARSSFTLGSAGVISGNMPVSSSDGGVYATNNAKCTLSGKISGNKSVGVFVSYSTVIFNGEISGNTAYNGGGVNMYAGSFTMTGGKISGNTATNTGGGVYMNGNAEFIMEGGFIGGATPDEANTATTYAGGVLVANGSKFTQSGGKISGNTAGTYGGGVYMNNGVTSSVSTYTMTGGTIDNNSAKIGGGGVGMVTTTGDCVFTQGSAGIISGNSATNSSSTGGGMYMTSSSTGTNTYAISGEISGNTAGNGGGIYLGNAGTCSLTGGKISGNKATGTSTGSGGGGVYVSGTATFTMSGGTIGGTAAADANNTEGFGGGGICANGSSAADRCTVKISGGTVSGNTSKNTGGGIFATNSNLTLGSAGSISGNKAGGGGGGLYAKNDTKCILEGTISGNSGGNGSGVYASNAECLFSGEISGNTANDSGAGAYLIDGSKFTMTGGKISGNKTEGVPTSNLGGGVYVSSAEFTMNGGTIGGTDAADANVAASGAGIYYVSTASIKLSGSVFVTGNKNDNGVTINIAVVDGNPLQITGALTGGTASIGVTPAAGVTDIASGTAAPYTITETDKEAFFADSGSGTFSRDAGSNKITYTP